MELRLELRHILEKLELVEMKYLALVVEESRAGSDFVDQSNEFTRLYGVPNLDMLDFFDQGPESDSERKLSCRRVYGEFIKLKEMRDNLELYRTIMVALKERQQELGEEYDTLLV